LHTVALVEQGSDFVLALQDTLARNFGRMRGKYRRDQSDIKKITDLSDRYAGFLHAVERVLQATLARQRADQVVRTAAADVVLVLGDIRQMQEVAEGPDDRNHRIAWQVVEDGFEFGSRRRVGLAVQVLVQLDGDLADALDDCKNIFALLLAYGVAKQATE
jgi:hypothetical protein